MPSPAADPRPTPPEQPEELQRTNAFDYDQTVLGTAYRVEGIDMGASIACDGVCLTVVAKGPDDSLAGLLADRGDAVDTVSIYRTLDTLSGGRRAL